MKKTGLIYFALVFFGLSLWEWPAHSPDLGWHLFGGAWILEHGQVPGRDFINTFNPTWHDYHWLGQVIFYKLYQFGGYEALQIFVALCFAFIFKLLVDIVALSDREEHLPGILKLLLALFGARCIAQIVSVRPQVLSLLILALVLKILLTGPKRFDLLKVSILAVIAVNIHVYWIFIPALWFSFTVLPTRFRVYDRSTVVGGAAGTLLLLCAGLFSPYGLLPIMQSGVHPWYINYTLLFDYLVMPAALQNLIGEMHSVLTAKGILPYLLLLSVALAGRIFSLRQVKEDSGSFAIAVASFCLSLRSLKFSAVFGIFSLPWFTAALVDYLPKGSYFFRKDKVLTKSIAICCILYFLGMSVWHFPYLNSKYQHITSMLPVDACRSISKLEIQPVNRKHLRILTHFNYGGWCRWILHENRPDVDYRVTTDGRTQWVDPQRIQASFDLFSLKGNWQNTLSSWKPDIVLVWKKSQLAQLLILDAGSWKLMYQDASFAVFLPIASAAQDARNNSS